MKHGSIPANGFPRPLRALAEQGGDPVAGFFGPDSVTWKVNREAAVYLGGLRALLLQLAHPKVAQGVADHSNFRRDPLARLWRTFETVHAMVFGTRDKALAAAARLHVVHSAIRGTLPRAAPGIDPRYSANDPDLLLWVYATLVDSSMHAYRTFIGPLPRAQWERFYAESQIFARLVGIDPQALPGDLREFGVYMDSMLAGTELAVTPTALDVAAALLKGPPVLYPFRPSNYVLAAGTLPPRMRNEFGLSWGLPVRAAYALGVRFVRTVGPALPPTLRTMPAARRAERRCRTYERLAA